MFAVAVLPPIRKLKTCLRLPLDGPAFTTYLQIVMSLLRISNLVMQVSLKKFPPSKVPSGEMVGSSEQSQTTKD